MASSYNYNGDQIVIVSSVFLSLTYVSVLLRCYVRAVITKSFSLDDWLMVVSQVVFTLSCIFILLGVHYGVGRHNSALSINNQTEALKWQTFATISYVANMMFIKLSIAIFLLRIAVERTYIWILRISVFIIVVWSTAIFIFEIFQCSPVSAQWDFSIKNPKCVSVSSFAAAAYAISVMTILSDWLYALLPIPMIWSVQMSIQAKVTVALVLSMGIFASIATLIRLKYIVELTSTEDILYTGTVAMVWTLVEPGVAITAASLVTIRPLLRSLKLTGFESSLSGNRYYQTTSRHQQISLRNDLPAGNWNSNTVTSSGTELKTTTSKNTLKASETKDKTGMSNDVTDFRWIDSDSESQEEILEGKHGIRRTVQVRIEHDRASSVGTPRR